VPGSAASHKPLPDPTHVKEVSRSRDEDLTENVFTIEAHILDEQAKEVRKLFRRVILTLSHLQQVAWREQDFLAALCHHKRSDHARMSPILYDRGDPSSSVWTI
jgi:hypothetical protein